MLFNPISFRVLLLYVPTQRTVSIIRRGGGRGARRGVLPARGSRTGWERPRVMLVSAAVSQGDAHFVQVSRFHVGVARLSELGDAAVRLKSTPEVAEGAEPSQMAF